MIEMKLNPAATIDTVRLDPIDIIPYQKSREFSHSRLVTQQICLGRTLLGKFHKRAIVANIHIEIEFVKTDFGLGLSLYETQAGGGLDKLVQDGRRAHDHIPARSPKAPLGLHEFKNFLRTVDPGRQLQRLAFRNADAKKQVQTHDENCRYSQR